MMSLSGLVSLSRVAAAAATGTSDVASAAVDMAGARGVLFLTSFDTPGPGNTIKLQGSMTGASDSFTDLAATEVGNGDSEAHVYGDLRNPLHRFVRAVVLRGTEAANGDVWAVKYDLLAR